MVVVAAPVGALATVLVSGASRLDMGSGSALTRTALSPALQYATEMGVVSGIVALSGDSTLPPVLRFAFDLNSQRYETRPYAHTLANGVLYDLQVG